MSVESKKPHGVFCANLKLFLASLASVYFSKAFGGAYMKSSITQIERRFDIPSSLIGVIDGSFEMGNLLVIAFVSYFGAKLHRPRLIAIGCVIMAAGCYLIALPHFFQGLYKYETSVSHVTNVNSTESILSCLSNHSLADETPDLEAITACEKAAGSSLWIYVFLGNMLRGIGETPIMPLGVSYLDDFSREENTPFYLACIHTVGILGPMFGFMLGSYLAKVYVDIGSVDLDSVTINYKDSRWVGAWWLGYLIAGFITLLSAIPFWFLPRSLPISGTQGPEKCTPEQTSFIKEPPLLKHKYPAEENTSFIEMAKDFIPTLRTLLGHPVYLVYLCVTITQLNSLIGMVTYKPKYIEQHFRQSTSKANFLMGVINIPAVALGMFSGGLLMKRLKLNIMGAAKMAFGTSLVGYILSLFFFAMSCENAKVAGVTLSYNSMDRISYDKHSAFAACNSNCFCSAGDWDPVCGENGITYVSPCLAGCTTSAGSGKNTLFSNCSCVGVAGNLTASTGQCPHKDDCERMFPYFLALSVVTSFIISLGGTPGYMFLIRCIKPQLKSLALGFHALATRTLAGIPAPIYFGAIIDTTCLKWGQKKCGGIGACRIYNTTSYRIAYLGLTLSLRTVSFFICIPGFILLRRQLRKEERNAAHGDPANGRTELEALRKEEFVTSNSDQSQQTPDNNTDRETRL